MQPSVLHVRAGVHLISISNETIILLLELFGDAVSGLRMLNVEFKL